MHAVRLGAALLVPVDEHDAALGDVAAALELLPRDPAEICRNVTVLYYRSAQSRDTLKNGFA